VTRHVVLIGLPGAGKTAAGRLAARTLGCPFCDVDARIEAGAGMTIAELFAREGEQAFRDVEREELGRALAQPPQVIAAGGGWAVQPGNLERARPRAFTVHLVCTPETAARRLAGTRDRPLLAGDMLERLRWLAAERTPFYQRADAAVPTDDRAVGDIAGDIVALARSAGGW
jgi:shikimate kinase